MKKLTKLLKGKKTYIVGLALFIVGGLKALGYDIPDEVLIFLNGGGLIALRASK